MSLNLQGMEEKMKLQKSKFNWQGLSVKERITKIQTEYASIGQIVDRKTAKYLYNSHTDCTVYTNETYQVNHYKGKQAYFIIDVKTLGEDFAKEMDYLSIKRRDKKSIHDWRDLQEIKNFICGEDREAVELYPKESRLVDTANQYHLFVYPKSFMIPFGFMSRQTIYKEVEGGFGKSGQRGK